MLMASQSPVTPTASLSPVPTTSPSPALPSPALPSPALPSPALPTPALPANPRRRPNRRSPGPLSRNLGRVRHRRLRVRRPPPPRDLALLIQRSYPQPLGCPQPVMASAAAVARSV